MKSSDINFVILKCCSVSYRKYFCYCGHRSREEPTKCGQLFDPQFGCSRSLGGCTSDASRGRLRGKHSLWSYAKYKT